MINYVVEDCYEELENYERPWCGLSGYQGFHGASKEEASTRDTVTAYREYKQVLQTSLMPKKWLKSSYGDADFWKKWPSKNSRMLRQKRRVRRKIENLASSKRSKRWQATSSLKSVELLREMRQHFCWRPLTMYQKYAEGWRFEAMEYLWTVSAVSKKWLWFLVSQFTLNSKRMNQGAHRVQRVPVTEKPKVVFLLLRQLSLIMPEVRKKWWYWSKRSSFLDLHGAGGQNVNKGLQL